jgi:putative oxidoreductase
MDVGLLVLRIVVGLLFVGHGTQKLFGWFGGPGVEGTGGFFSQLGYPRGREMAALAGLAEMGSGALLALGFLTPLGAAAIIGVMLNAIVSVHWRNGMWVTKNGIEYPLVLATVALALAFAGPGQYSIDSALGWNLSSTEYGLAALFLGIGSGAFALGLRRVAPVARPAQQHRPRAA